LPLIEQLSFYHLPLPMTCQYSVSLIMRHWIHVYAMIKNARGPSLSHCQSPITLAHVAVAAQSLQSRKFSVNVSRVFHALSGQSCHCLLETHSANFLILTSRSSSHSSKPLTDNWYLYYIPSPLSSSLCHFPCCVSSTFLVSNVCFLVILHDPCLLPTQFKHSVIIKPYVAREPEWTLESDQWPYLLPDPLYQGTKLPKREAGEHATNATSTWLPPVPLYTSLTSCLSTGITWLLTRVKCVNRTIRINLYGATTAMNDVF
jgi:hypothetical protein